MKTWADYKDYVKRLDPDNKKDMEEVEAIASIIGAVIQQRNELGITQRDLALICNIPQSSVARIESFRTTPNLDTLIKIMRPLGLKLIVAHSDSQVQRATKI